jgi:hypothetical protein
MKKKEICQDCRFYFKTTRRMGQEIRGWCYVKDKPVPKNPCTYWRPQPLRDALVENRGNTE